MNMKFISIGKDTWINIDKVTEFSKGVSKASLSDYIPPDVLPKEVYDSINNNAQQMSEPEYIMVFTFENGTTTNSFDSYDEILTRILKVN